MLLFWSLWLLLSGLIYCHSSPGSMPKAPPPALFVQPDFVFPMPDPDEERILNQMSEDPNPANVSCVTSQTDATHLICVCWQPLNDANEKEVHSVADGSRLYNRLMQSKKSIRSLTFLLCSLRFAPDVFTLFQLERLEIKGSLILDLEKRSLSFPPVHPGTMIYIETIGAPIELPQEAFGPGVSKVVLNQTRLEQFSSNIFSGLNHTDSEILIVNSTIEGLRYDHRSLFDFKVGSFIFHLVKFKLDVNGKFFKIAATNVLFVNVSMNLIGEDVLMVSDAVHVSFVNCTLGQLHAFAMNITANHINFVNTTFNEPQQHAFMGLVGANESATLTFQNILLNDPSSGALLSNFPEVIFSNIVSAKCKCELVLDLVDNQVPFGSRLIPTLPIEELQVKLLNETYCHPRYNRSILVRATDACQLMEDRPDTGYIIVVVLLAVGLMVACAIMTFLAYYWHDKIRKKQNMIKKWSFVVPGPSYREPKVQFNLEQVEYISRPCSTVFAIDSSALDDWRGSQFSLTNETDGLVNHSASEIISYQIHPPLDPITEENDDVWTSVGHFRGGSFPAKDPKGDEVDKEEKEDEAPSTFLFLRSKTKRYKSSKNA